MKPHLTWIFLSAQTTYRFSLLTLLLISQTSSDSEDEFENSESEVLKVLTLHHPPFVTIDFNNPTKPVKGFLVDILEHLANELNFHYTFLFSVDEKFGSFSQSNGRWNGLIWDVMNHKADMVLAGLTVNNIRKQFVEFSVPYMTSKLGLYFRKPDRGQTMPFSNLKQLLASKHYSFGPIESGSTITYLNSSSEHFPLHRELTTSSKLILPKSHDEGITWAYYSNFVFITEERFLSYSLNTEYCELMGLTMSPVTVEYGFAFPRDTANTRKWLPKMNQEIQKLVDDQKVIGTKTLTRLQQLWWNDDKKEKKCPNVEFCCEKNCFEQVEPIPWYGYG